MGHDTDLGEIAGHVYGVALSDFTAARNAAAKALTNPALAEQVKRFPKPSVAAHLLNQLVREQPHIVADVRSLSARLRASQADADAAGLRALDHERRDVVSRAVGAGAAAAERAGGRASDPVLRDVEQTVRAALVDPDALAALQAGTLLRPLSPNGFDPVDLSGASAVPAATRPHRAPVPRRDGSKDKRIRADAARAEAGLDQARVAVEASEKSLTDVRERAEELRKERDRLHEQIAAIDEALLATKAEESRRRSDLRTAMKTLRTAASEHGRAQRLLNER